MIMIGGEVSRKHPLKWWIMPFVVGPGIGFTVTWDFVGLFSLLPSPFLMMESSTISVFSYYHYVCNYYHLFGCLLFFTNWSLFWSLPKWYCQWRFSVMIFPRKVYLFCYQSVYRNFNSSSRLCSLLVVKIHSDPMFWL